MMYQVYQIQDDFLSPFRVAAQATLDTFDWFGFGKINPPFMRNMTAGFEMLTRARLSHARPSFNIDTVMVGNAEVAVTEETAMVAPFGTLLHFKKDTGIEQPRVLLVAPLSGHFATLLRLTVKTLLRDHDVYITDWHNARDVPVSDGRFGMDEYVEHLIRFLEHLGGNTHVIAVCQPCVQALAATAIMAEDNHPATPPSLTLMAGPIDGRINPTKVNELAMTRPISWFRDNLISSVPFRHPGAGRRVYPGFMQLNAFMAMNMDRHMKAHSELYKNLAEGDVEKADVAKKFYDEYFAVLDLTAEFYLETVELVFQKFALAKGELTYKGRKVDPSKIRKTTLFTVEGERDDICAVGQTAAAHDLTPKIAPFRKRHHLQPGVGHYGVFSGKKWDGQIYPMVRNVILAAN